MLQLYHISQMRFVEVALVLGLLTHAGSWAGREWCRRMSGAVVGIGLGWPRREALCRLGFSKSVIEIVGCLLDQRVRTKLTRRFIVHFLHFWC